MAYTKLGRIRPVYSGEWSSGRAYTALEMVRTPDGGLSYIAQKDVPAGTPLTNGEYWAVVLDVREVLEAAKNAADRVDAVMDVKANVLSATAAGNPVQFSPDEHSIIKPVLTLLPVQSGSGEPSPSNIRPIAGRTGAVLTRSGKNLLDMRGAVGGTSNGITAVVNADGSFHISGTASSADINIWFRGNYGLTSPLFTLQPGTYYVKNVVLFNNTTALGGLYSGGVLTLNAATPVTGIRCVSLNAGQSFDMTVYPAIYIGNSNQEWQSYQGDTYPLDFGQTIYGGVLNWNKGVLAVDMAKVTLTGAETWNDYGDGSFLLGVLSDAVAPGYNEIPAMMCSHYPAVMRSVIAENKGIGVGIGSETHLIVNPGTGYTTDTFKSFLAAQYAAGTPVQIAYKLANPITISLTPQQITALAGVNTVYGDADEITVHYNKSLNAAFEELKNAILAMGGNV